MFRIMDQNAVNVRNKNIFLMKDSKYSSILVSSHILARWGQYMNPICLREALSKITLGKNQNFLVLKTK